MVTFLFWNVNGRPRQIVLGRMAKEHEVDVVILAECNVRDGDVIEALASETGKPFHKPWSGPGRIKIFTTLPEDAVRPVFDDPTQRLTIRRLIVGNRDILLAAVHFQSKVNWSDADQQEESRNLARHIRLAEEENGHSRTVLVGDLNMNPFDHGVISSHSLHAVMTRSIAKQHTRKVAGNDYPFFYNPMWGCFGDRTAGPPGTHYFRAPRPLLYFWNVFDQVLIRPELLDTFRDDLSILHSAGETSLLSKNGIPNKNVGSDHLPILFSLHL